MLTSLKISCRFLRKSKIQTLIIILGIAIGVSVQIFIGLLSRGLEGTLVSKVTGSFVHISMNIKKGNIENWQEKRDKIKKLGVEATTIAPVLERNGFIQINNDEKQNVQVRGFLTEDVNALYDMKNKVYEGKMISSGGQVLVGKDLKEKLGVKLGDNIEITAFDGKKNTFNIVGFYDLGAIKLNSIWIITDLKTAQNAFETGDVASSIEIAVKDANNADIIASRIQSSFKDLKVENWKDSNKLLASAIIGQKICSVIIQFFVLLAAVLSIISILGISVVQKYKQIGILKAMGIWDSSAAFIFFLQALILGILGTALGVALTFGYIKAFNRYIIAADGTPIVNIIVNNRFIIISAAIDIAASTLAALFPAFKSFRLSPVEVIKNG